LITKLVLAEIEATSNSPTAVAPLSGPRLRKINEAAVTALVATVAVPEARATDPKELAPAVVVLATLVLSSLFPAVPKTTLPLVAVILPRVAVIVVPDASVVVVASDPGAVIRVGRLSVVVVPVVLAVICAAVPRIVSIAPEPVPSRVHVAVPPERLVSIQAVEAEFSTAIVPREL
jgi:hypothetical protein